MTIRLSSGLRDAVISNYGLGATLFGGRIQIYSGTQPLFADLPPTGVLLATVTQAGGLQLQLGPRAGDIVNAGEWTLTGLADGTPGWWRFVGPGADDGTESAALPRLDGVVADSVQDMPLTISTSTSIPLAGFILSLPDN